MRCTVHCSSHFLQEVLMILANIPVVALADSFFKDLVVRCCLFSKESILTESHYETSSPWMIFPNRPLEIPKSSMMVWSQIFCKYSSTFYLFRVELSLTVVGNFPWYEVNKPIDDLSKKFPVKKSPVTIPQIIPSTLAPTIFLILPACQYTVWW